MLDIVLSLVQLYLKADSCEKAVSDLHNSDPSPGEPRNTAKYLEGMTAIIWHSQSSNWFKIWRNRLSTVWLLTELYGPFRNCQSWSFITVHGQFKSNRLGLYCQVTIWPRKNKRKTPSQAFTRSKQIYRNGRSLKFCGTVHCSGNGCC